MSLESIDTLIEARWVVPIEPPNLTLENHALAIDAGRIVALVPAASARQRFDPRRHVSLPEHVLLPGLVNLHTHAAMCLLRGYADDMTLASRLSQRIYPAEAKHVSHDFVRDGTALACTEMLRGGITCFNDMYFYPEAAALAASSVGIRAALGIVVEEFATAYGADAEDYLVKGLAARDALRDAPLISFCMAPGIVADNSLERIATLAAQLDLPVHMHLHETITELKQSMKQHGVRPLARLARMGLLGPNLIAVHGVHLTSDEIALLADHRCTIVHCPTSNLKLGSGIAPVAAMLARGVRVGLGTDGAASNNRLDMWRELHQATLLTKGASGDVTALDAHGALYMATMGGAVGLGLDDQIGSLVVGKQADLCAVQLDDLMLQPCFDPVSHVIYTAGREHVSHVWVAGEPRVHEHTLLADTAALRAVAMLWHNRLMSDDEI